MADKLRSFIENKDASGLGLTAAHISAKVVPSPSTAAGKFPGSVYCDNTAQKEL